MNIANDVNAREAKTHDSNKNEQQTLLHEF